MEIQSNTELILFLKKWKNKKAAEYAAKIAKHYGLPDYVKPAVKNYNAGCCWINIAGVNKVKVMDEAIEHDFPEEHYDFVYSSLYCTKPIKPSHVADLAKVSGSIMVDALKNQITARCGMLIKNAVTLQFAKDVIENKTKATKGEYAKRIKKNSPTIPYKDVLMEYEHEEREKKMKENGIEPYEDDDNGDDSPLSSMREFIERGGGMMY